jgi:hypothetical protein
VKTGIGDQVGDGLDPVEGVEEKLAGAVPGMGRGENADAVLFGALDGVEGHGGTDEVAGEVPEALGIVGGDALAGMDGEAGVDPVQEDVAEGLGEPIGGDEPGEEKASEELAQGLRIERGDGDEAAVAVPDRFGHEGVDVRVEVGVGTEGLDGGDEAGDDMAVVEDRDEGAMHGVVGGAGEESEEPALSLEQPTQDAGDGEHVMAVGDGGEDLLPEFLGEEGRALGLAARAEVTGLAGEGQEVLAMARWAADPGEAAGEPAALEERIGGAAGDGAQWTVLRLEAVFVRGEVAVEVVLEDPIEVGALGVTRPVQGRRIGDTVMSEVVLPARRPSAVAGMLGVRGATSGSTIGRRCGGRWDAHGDRQNGEASGGSSGMTTATETRGAEQGHGHRLAPGSRSVRPTCN